jgi:putative ABC transport system permease protein
VTATLAAPPPALAPSPAGAGRRAIRRWAWRLLRREWRQQLLVLALLLIAVAATTVGLGVVVNVTSSDQAQFGTATTRLDVTIASGQAASTITAANRAFGSVEVIEHESVPVPGSVTPIDLRAQDPHGRYGAPMLRLVSGHWPTGAGQAAVTASVGSKFNLKIGDSWPVHGRALRVVGMVENSKDLQDVFGLVAPGQLPSPSALTLLTDASGDSAVQFRPPAGNVVNIMSNGASAAQRQRTQALAVLLLATIGLSFIGLLCVAGFTVMAQRRLRALGMIAAIGATDRQIRRVLLANGAAVGTVGAGAGIVLGLAVWFALRPAFEHLVGHRIDPVDIPWWAVAAGAVLAILTALAASWWPGRSAARMPIVAALSGRPTPPQPARRFALLGVVLTVAGFVLLVLARAAHTVLIVTGIIAITAGTLLLAPLGIRALAVTAGRAPVAVRLALRDLARYQARSGAAVAAASLALGIAATIAISAAAQQAADHTLSSGNLPTNQIIVWLQDPHGQGLPGLGAAVETGNGRPSPSPAIVAKGRSTADSIAQAVGTHGALELDRAVDPTPVAGSMPQDHYAGVARPVSQPGRDGFNVLTAPFLATPATLDLYRIPAGDIQAGTDILTARTDLTGTQLLVPSQNSRSGQPARIQVTTRLPRYTSAPNTLITEQAATDRRLIPQPAGWLVQSPHPLTSAQITDAQHRAAAAGIAVETRTAPDDSQQKLRDYATVVGALLALGVLAMTVGLIRSETANDLRVLAAAGASSRTRRSLTAATAAALALLGAVLGIAGAYLALIAWHWHDIGYLAHPPYPNLAALLVGLPMVALLGGWLLGRSATIARRSLE